ncbi:MAG: isoprenylcysteine carboxylmethyltransferase family protein [Deltaproteobacteria bacterium]|nr:isoprenylcysteine carboxylmethyltransferase family protein [Deltaproteobacteria bacterium]
MLEKVVGFIAKHSGQEHSTLIRIMSLVLGIFVFLIFSPLALGIAGHLIAECVHINVPRTVEMSLGVTGISVGFFFLFWSVSAFWFVGRGTPFPFASPTRLVTSGPFNYTRNPIKLGAVLFYFGIGTICDQLVTGIIMLAIGVLLGTIYHKSVEEKELVIRFGKNYEDYRKRTSFFIPLSPRKSKKV